jgi:subtilisin family serine protease
VTWPPAVLKERDAVVAAATAAVAAGTAAGQEQITVIALDPASRPVFVPATTANAIDVATITAQTMAVVGVEPDVESRPSMPPSSGAQTTDTAAATDTTTATETAGALQVSTDPLVGDQWAQAAYPFSALWRCGRGAGVRVAVVDTGVDATHPDFDGRVTAGVAFDDGGPRLGQGGVDPNGHGTHIAGIIGAGDNGIGVVGVAPEVTIVPVRALRADQTGSSRDLANAITWAANEGVDVINASLGADGQSRAVLTATDYAQSIGVVIMAAGGNAGPNGPVRYPAGFPGVLGISPVGESGALAPFATRGPHIDLAAPGRDILSTTLSGGWNWESGSSMATAHVSGLAALVTGARGRIGPAAMAARLMATATDAGPPGRDDSYGAGRIDPVRAMFASI